jgi:hypothetical protein
MRTVMNPFPEGFQLYLIPPRRGKTRAIWSLVSPSGIAVRLTTSQGAILAVLMGRYGKPVLRETLYQLFWGHDEEGGPNDPEKVMDVQLSKIRKTCRSLGINFECKSNYDRRIENRTIMITNMCEIEPVGVRSREYMAFEEVEDRRKKPPSIEAMPPAHTVLAFVRRDREPLRIAQGKRA